MEMRTLSCIQRKRPRVSTYRQPGGGHSVAFEQGGWGDVRATEFFSQPVERSTGGTTTAMTAENATETIMTTRARRMNSSSKAFTLPLSR